MQDSRSLFKATVLEAGVITAALPKISLSGNALISLVSLARLLLVMAVEVEIVVVVVVGTAGTVTEGCNTRDEDCKSNSSNFFLCQKMR